MNLRVDWVSMAILLVAYVFSRVPGVNARLGNGAIAAACGIIGYRYWERFATQKVQFNLVMMGVAGALGLYYLSKAVTGAGTKKKEPPKDDDE